MRNLASLAAALGFVTMFLVGDSGATPQPLPQAIETLLDQLLSDSEPPSGNQTIAVVPFVKLDTTTGSACSTLLGRFIAERISTRLIMRGRQVVERSRLDAAIEEMDLNRRTTFDQESAQKLGELVGADLIFTGTLTELFNTIEVDGRLFGTETAASLKAAFATLVKDQDILQLIRDEKDCQVGGLSSPPSDESGSNPEEVFETQSAGDLRADLLGCWREASKVICNVRLTQKSRGQNVLYGGPDGASIYDTTGQQYPFSFARFGAREGDSMLSGRFPGGIPVGLVLTFEGFPQHLQVIPGLSVATYQGSFSFTNIPLSQLSQRKP